jgi:hypothetical protein
MGLDQDQDKIGWMWDGWTDKDKGMGQDEMGWGWMWVMTT